MLKKCGRNGFGWGLPLLAEAWSLLWRGKLVWLTVHLLSLWSLCPQSWPMLSGIQVLGMHAGFMSTMYHFIHCTWVSGFVFLGELVPIPQSTKRPFIFLLKLVCYLTLHVKVLRLFSGCIHSYSKGWSLWNISLCIYTETLSFNEKKKHLIKERYKKAGRRIHRETAGCVKESGIKCYKNNMLLCSDLS